MHGIFQLYECPARQGMIRAFLSRINLYVGRRGPRLSAFLHEQGSRFAISAQSTLRQMGEQGTAMTSS